jgi:hypothetical protein
MHFLLFFPIRPSFSMSSRRMLFPPSDNILVPQRFPQTSGSRDAVERNGDDCVDREQLHSSKPDGLALRCGLPHDKCSKDDSNDFCKVDNEVHVL